MLRFDMRAPDIGASPVELYAAATEMCAWAEGHGCLAAVLCEHHGADDGYLPSPMILGSAVAARTERLKFGPSVLVTPFRAPVLMARELAMIDYLSGGRMLPAFGIGDPSASTAVASS